MFRSFVFASVAGTGSAQLGSCSDGLCGFDLRPLEEFTVDFNLVMTASLADGLQPGLTTGFTTSPLPSFFPTEHGSIAVHARNLQLKADSHLMIPPGTLPPNPVLSQLEGADIHEELHINGAATPAQASFHLASPLLNICIQLDNLPVPPQASAMVDANLQQAEQMAPMIMQMSGGHFSVDGETGMGLVGDGGRLNVNAPNMLIFSDESHPELLMVSPPGATSNDIGVKFSNYADTVGNAFAVRACEVETHSATQSLLASSPEVRDFISNRIAAHQNRLQGLLEPAALNTRYNFIPLMIADMMVAPGGQPCSNELLAVASSKDASIFHFWVFGACSFAMGLAVTYGALRKRSVVSADAYHEVSA